MAVLDMTMAIPSVATNAPARAVMAGEWKRFCARRHSRKTVMTPQMAPMMRQPTGSDCPSRRIPQPMIHFPVGGWTG